MSFVKRVVKTKSFFVGIATIVTGIGMYVQGDVANGFQTILTGVSLIVLRDAVAKAPRSEE